MAMLIEEVDQKNKIAILNKVFDELKEKIQGVFPNKINIQNEYRSYETDLGTHEKCYFHIFSPYRKKFLFFSLTRRKYLLYTYTDGVCIGTSVKCYVFDKSIYGIVKQHLKECADKHNLTLTLTKKFTDQNERETIE